VRILHIETNFMQTMRALTVHPGVANSLQLEEFRLPRVERGAVLLRAVALGVGTSDRDVVAAKYGAPPPGHQRLIIGHESVGRIEDAPPASGLVRGSLAVGIVRHPDPLPCEKCAAGEWDRCDTGDFTERGITSLDGFGSEWYRLDSEFIVPLPPSLHDVGVLVEPTSVVAKAWEQTDHVGRCARWPRRVLVIGAGSTGLLAAMLGAQRAFEVHVFDRTASGRTPALVRALGATYHCGTLDAVPGLFDLVMECTGVDELARDAIARLAPDGTVCLVGGSAQASSRHTDVVSFTHAALGDRVAFSSVSANRRHYEMAMSALTLADPDWLRQLITRRVSLAHWREAFEQRPDDVKTVIDFTASADASLPSN
jgi:threonine dehydrogenase-like Zn-dependent dehydrogenase